MSASLIFMVPTQTSVGSAIPIVVARKNIGSSTPGVVKQNGPRHPATRRLQSISRVYTCLLSALRCGEGWFNGEKMLYRIMQTAHTVLFLWDIQYCFYGTCDMHLLVFSAFSWEISWVVAGRYGAKWQHTICALSVCKRDVSCTLHFVHAKLSSFPKSLLKETWPKQKKTSSLFTNNDTTITICITNIIITTIILSTFTLYLPIRPLLHPLPFPTARIEPLAVCRFSRNTRWPVAVGEPFHEAQPKSSVNNSVFLLSRQNDDALKFNRPWMPNLNYENPFGACLPPCNGSSAAAPETAGSRKTWRLRTLFKPHCCVNGRGYRLNLKVSKFVYFCGLCFFSFYGNLRQAAQTFGHVECQQIQWIY